MRMSEIAEYIIEKYPNCCMVANNRVKIGYREDWYEEGLVEDLMDFFRYEIINNCGCGNPEITDEAIRKVLLSQQFLQNKTEKDNWDIYYEKHLEYKKELFGSDYQEDFKFGLIQFMMYQLDSCGILEHGSGIGGAWLTNLGKMYLEVLNAWSEQNDNN